MRALILILDGVGAGNAPDAAAYGDRGADTLGHVFLHHRTLELPHLFALGLGRILSGDIFDPSQNGIHAAYGRMRAVSPGKETMSGHWEIAGFPVKEPFATFPEFPATLVAEIENEAAVKFLGNQAQNGTSVIDQLGEAHLQSGHPILCPSHGSVMQIAAHEEVIPLKRLYQICRIARCHCDAHRIGRIIAQPFIGVPGHFTRTAGSHDFSMTPPRTVLNAIAEAGLAVIGVGKTGAVFARSGITGSHSAQSNREAMEIVENLWQTMPDGLIFANLPDFDSLHGHGRDLHGFAGALSEFDAWLGGFQTRIEPGDLMILTADHGNDPTFPGNDHTREEVPLIALCDGKPGPLGVRDSFADVAATLAAFFHLPQAWPVGRALFSF